MHTFWQNHILAESHFGRCDAEDNIQSQLLERKLSSSEVDRRINATVAPLSTLFETMIQLIKELSERSSNRSIEGNVNSEQSESSGQHSDIHLHLTQYKNPRHSTLIELLPFVLLVILLSRFLVSISLAIEI